MSQRLDCAGMLRAGLTRLQLGPATFWALTPVELMMLLGLDRAAPAMGRDRLAELLAAFPDPGAEPKE